MSLVPTPTISEEISTKISSILSNLNPIQSDWSYVGFDNAGASVGMPIGVSVGATGGVLSIQQQGASQPNKVKCGSLDTGLGISPVPFNITFPLPKMPGTGIIFKLPCIAPTTLSINSFRGGYVLFGGSIGCGPTAGVTFMFFGAKVIPTMGSCVSLIPKIMLTSPILIASLSVFGSLPDAGLSASIGVGI